MQFHHHHKFKKYHSHGKRTLDIDFLAVNSEVAHMNPQVKMLLGIGSLIVCLLSIKGFTAMIVAVAMVVFTLQYGKIKKYDYWQMITIPFWFIVLSAIVLLFDISTHKIGVINISIFTGYLSITKENIKTAIRVSIRAFCGVNCLYMISLSTPLYEIISVLKKCKVPEIMIELMYLMYRFIFIILETYNNMKTAADTRLGFTTLRRSYRTFFGICSNLFVISFQKALRSFDAMEARCYDGKLQFLEKNKPVTIKQIGVLITYFIVIITLLIIERTWM